MVSENFYSNLPLVRMPIHEVFSRAAFEDVPASWYVVMTDVKNSTVAVNEGRHNDVNLVAASSLVVALNLGRAAGIEIPFFFTGDGGTMMVPEALLQRVLQGLQVHNQNSIRNFGLELHLGHLSIQQVKDAGHFIQIAKVEFFENFNKPVVLGNGLKYAEEVIKSPHETKDLPADNNVDLNMDGLECRWDKIKPPTPTDEIVCYIIEAVDADTQKKVFEDILKQMNEIYGSPVKRNPLSVNRLKLLLSIKKIKNETMARYGKWKSTHFAKGFLEMIFGFLWFRLNLKIIKQTGKEQLIRIMNNADTLTIDGRINTIITGLPENRERLLAYLQAQEKNGILRYGHHISKESIMTCYIENRQDKHIHFVDGGDGGYTEASKELKLKLMSTITG
ncbi:MAG: DUF3095 family protein [Gloeobacteraceae cyanobacterium ES-bin-316]|nr:DUF3095 family protein [Ferruginibacter sp.]